MKKKIQDNYGDVLSDKQIAQAAGYKFKDWGRLSKELLQVEGIDKSTGEESTVYNGLIN